MSHRHGIGGRKRHGAGGARAQRSNHEYINRQQRQKGIAGISMRYRRRCHIQLHEFDRQIRFGNPDSLGGTVLQIHRLHRRPCSRNTQTKTVFRKPERLARIERGSGICQLVSFLLHPAETAPGERGAHFSICPFICRAVGGVVAVRAHSLDGLAVRRNRPGRSRPGH